MTTQQDPYLDGINNYDALEHQVNNVIAGKAPNSFDFQKILKNPLVYLGATFLIFLIILWFWSPGFMKDDEEKTKLWLLLVITTSLSLASTGAIWWFFLKKKKVWRLLKE